jgi:splicing factor 3B subunit 3
MDIPDSVHLYNVTLQPSTAIHKAILGNFSGTKQQEIVVARNSIVELWKLDTNTGKLQSVLSLNVFGIIRSIVPFRLTGASKGRNNRLVKGISLLSRSENLPSSSPI